LFSLFWVGFLVWGIMLLHVAILPDYLRLPAIISDFLLLFAFNCVQKVWSRRVKDL